MTGWISAPRDREKRFPPPSVRSLPELGRLTGRGDTLNLERLLETKPDVVIDFGSINDTYRSLADRVQAQTGIPYLLIDGRFDSTATAYRLLADILGVKERGEALAREAEAHFARVDRVVAATPSARRPRVYLARGPDGLESGSRGSINTEIIERVGAVNVVEVLRERGGIVRVSPEQVIAWAPDTIMTLDKAFARAAPSRAEWKLMSAVASGRVFVSPSLPWGFIDAPPSVNRLSRMTWLLHKLYPAATGGDLGEETRAFYRMFYQVELSDADLTDILDAPND